MIRRKQIRKLAEKLLAEHHVRSAPISAASIAKAHGAEVQLQSAKDDLSGFLYRDRETKHAVIGVNANHHVNRQNFTAAHELGHFLLHDFDDIHVDRGFKVWLRSKSSSQGVDVEEMEANLFAAELLMPEQFLAKDVERLEALDLLDEGLVAKLAETYKVSIQAMTFRLAYLGYIHH
jgi:Zn-dependent peptidase ImmA (M78 family)